MKTQPIVRIDDVDQDYLKFECRKDIEAAPLSWSWDEPLMFKRFFSPFGAYYFLQLSDGKEISLTRSSHEFTLHESDAVDVYDFISLPQLITKVQGET